tara:strand:- start:248 stop:556 length:309 start_codon:yes stop_codon:yes gene_type:complete
MITWVFLLFSLLFIFCWWINTNKKRKNQISNSHSSATRTAIKVQSVKPKESLSEFQEWILSYAQKSSAEDLEESLKLPFEKNDWNFLEPTVYEKWSKFKWGI